MVHPALDRTAIESGPTCMWILPVLLSIFLLATVIRPGRTMFRRTFEILLDTGHRPYCDECYTVLRSAIVRDTSLHNIQGDYE